MTEAKTKNTNGIDVVCRVRPATRMRSRFPFGFGKDTIDGWECDVHLVLPTGDVQLKYVQFSETKPVVESLARVEARRLFDRYVDIDEEGWMDVDFL